MDYTSFEMYSDSADRYVEQALRRMQITTRVGLGDVLGKTVAKIAEKHGEIYDTEPQWAVIDWVNGNICEPNMWLPVSRDDI